LDKLYSLCRRTITGELRPKTVEHLFAIDGVGLQTREGFCLHWGTNCIECKGYAANLGLAFRRILKGNRTKKHWNLVDVKLRLKCPRSILNRVISYLRRD
jgi:hypothetical protein